MLDPEKIRKIGDVFQFNPMSFADEKAIWAKCTQAINEYGRRK